MEYHIDMRRSQRRDFIESVVAFYIKELKLTRSRYFLAVVADQNVVRDQGINGGVIQSAPSVIGMVLDNRLPVRQLVQTIAHEMVHVKQIARGRLQNRVIRNELVNVWRGQVFRAKDLVYHRRPWELEAFRQERELAYRLWEVIGDPSK